MPSKRYHCPKCQPLDPNRRHLVGVDMNPDWVRYLATKFISQDLRATVNEELRRLGYELVGRT